MICSRSKYDLPTLAVVLLFIAAIVAIVETHRDEIEADEGHRHHSH